MEGSSPKSAAILTAIVASDNYVAYVESEGNAQTESESPMKLQGKRRGRWRKASAKKVQFEESTTQKGQDNDNVRANCTSQKPVTTIPEGDGDIGLMASEDCAREHDGRFWAINPSDISMNQVIDSSAGIEGWAGYEGPKACDQEPTVHIPSTKPPAEILRDRQRKNMIKARRYY